MNKSKSGFTIVELLIVIVVIGILAAITIVAYNGIQSRARNTQQISTAKAYLSAFAGYVAVNGAYPPYGTARVCLGVDQAACSSSTAWNRDSVLETGLKTIMSLATPNSAIAIVSTPKMGFVPINSSVTLDGISSAFLIYTLESPGTCSAGTPASGIWPSYTSTVPSQGYTGTEGSLRVCMIALPPV